MSLNKEKNFVSAVVYLYNEENSVKKFLTSINELLKTNFEKYEIICVNDTSTDNTARAVEEFCDENSVKSLTMIDTSFFQGVENAMVAGLDISIGDFVFEFDSCLMDYEPTAIMEVYKKSLTGYDIVFAVPEGASKFSSRMFYKTFNKFSNMNYKIKTQRFSIISRRGINRVKSIGVRTVYRKAVYASCGLPATDYVYKPLENAKRNDAQYPVKKNLALNSLILFTDVGYKISVGLSALMAFVRRNLHGGGFCFGKSRCRLDHHNVGCFFRLFRYVPAVCHCLKISVTYSQFGFQPKRVCDREYQENNKIIFGRLFDV